MKKILSVIGARPQFIKAAPVSRALSETGVKEVIVHTGQHYDKNMSQLFFDELGIKKEDYNLQIGSGTHGEQTGKMLIALEKVVLKEKPSVMLIYGDTNSTLSGALVAAKLHIPIAHVEAGLRSFNMKMPEEVNRIVADRLSNLLFCPTNNAVRNLKEEAITDGVYNTGDVMYDATLNNVRIAERKSTILDKLGLRSQGYILATIHRAENTDIKKRLTTIFEALLESNKNIILPLHPRTNKFLEKYDLLKNIEKSNIKIIQPVGYLDMLKLEKSAKKIITDSGGVQKEAYFMEVPCITLREETEWIETIDNGNNVIAGAKKDLILQEISNNKEYLKSVVNYFGDGNASDKIARILSE